MKGIIRENSRSRGLWDVFVLAMVLASCALVPFQVAFVHEVRLGGSVAVYLIDLVFLADILLNRRTSHHHLGSEVTDRRRVSRHYARTLLPWDVVGTVPLDLLLLPWAGESVLGVSILLFARLNRLVRVVRMVAIFRRWERASWTNSAQLRIGKLVLSILLLLHWVACAWFFIPYSEGFPTQSWVASQGVDSAERFTQYVRSLYWVVVTTTTVGYGDITPNRDVEYVFTLVVMFLIIGNIASLVSSLDSAKAAFWGRAEAANAYLRSRRVSEELNESVRGYYDYIWSRFRGMNEKTLFADLPAPIRLEILVHLTKELDALRGSSCTHSPRDPGSPDEGAGRSRPAVPALRRRAPQPPSPGARAAGLRPRKPARSCGGDWRRDLLHQPGRARDPFRGSGEVPRPAR